MTDLHFTLQTETIQNLIEKSIEDDGSKNFNQLMEKQRAQYLLPKDYERSNQRVSQGKGSYERAWTPLEKDFAFENLDKPRWKVSPNSFWRWQWKGRTC